MKILIAENDLVSRKFLSKILEQNRECYLAKDGLETVDAFLLALMKKEPYDLVCLDIMLPESDGVKTLQVIRDIEKETYVVKPIEIKKLTEVFTKLGLIESPSVDSINGKSDKEIYCEASMNKSKQSIPRLDLPCNIFDEGSQMKVGYFRSVYAKDDYQLEVIMETGSTIHFDFRSRLNTVRFGMLRDVELFHNVRTDGLYLIFEKDGKMPVRITASEFMDLVMIDRRK